jgi:hypothetical protein
MTSTQDSFMEVLDLPITAAFSGRDAIGPFLGLSAVLLERTGLEPWIGRAYLKTLIGFATPPGAAKPNAPAYTALDIERVLRRYAELQSAFARDPVSLVQHVQNELLRAADAGTANVTRSVAALWYCAGIVEFDSGMGFMSVAAPIETYSSALVWQTVGANPMGIPGPYYGNWAYPAPVQIIRPDA